MIQTQKIKSIQYKSIKDAADDKRKIPQGLFKPHMTALISSMSK